MTRVSLRVTQDPPQAEVMLRCLRFDGNWEFITAVVDTGAEVSLLPSQWRDIIAHDRAETIPMRVERGGRDDVVYDTLEAKVTAYIEDEQGNQSEPFLMTVWFAPTNATLLGMTGALDRAVLHLDMPTLTGYIELS